MMCLMPTCLVLSIIAWLHDNFENKWYFKHRKWWIICCWCMLLSVEKIEKWTKVYQTEPKTVIPKRVIETEPWILGTIPPLLHYKEVNGKLCYGHEVPLKHSRNGRFIINEMPPKVELEPSSCNTRAIDPLHRPCDIVCMKFISRKKLWYRRVLSNQSSLWRIKGLVGWGGTCFLPALCLLFLIVKEEIILKWMHFLAHTKVYK